MKGKHLILTFLFLLVLLPVINAAPPFESTNDGGLQFGYPPYEVVKANEPFYFHLHVINDTALQTNATTSCFVHVYTSNGEHSLQNNMGWDSNNLEFKLDIDAGNFTFGQHAYVIICNNTNKQIHEVEGVFDATPLGATFDTPKSIAYSILLIVLLVLFIFVISRFDESDNYGYVAGLLSLSYFLLTFIVFVLDILARGIFYDAPALASFTSLALVIMLIGIFPLIIFLFFYLMSKRMEDSEVKKLTGMGYSDSEARSLKRK